MLMRRFLLALLLCASADLAHGADTLNASLVHEVMQAASHARYGTPATVTIRMEGNPVTFLFSVDAVGNITAVPQSANAPVRQISIGVTTTNAGVVPNAVTLITNDGQVEGFSIATNKDGAITGVTTGGPVTTPTGTTVAKSHESGPGTKHGDEHVDFKVGGSELVDYSPPSNPSSPGQVAGAGIQYAPGTSPASQNVSPH